MINTNIKQIARLRYENILWSYTVSFSFLFYITFGLIFAHSAGSWPDEINYLMKSWLYVTGQVAPYSDQDATQYMPLFFFQLGAWQQIFGIGLFSGRLMSLTLGLVNLFLIYRITRNLTADPRSAALAVFLMSTTLTAVAFWTTAAPYASVSLISLIVFYLITKNQDINLVLNVTTIGFLYFLSYFYRPNMIIAIGLFCILQLVYFEKARLVAPITSFLVFLLCSALFLTVMPEKLLAFALRLPRVTPLLTEWGVFTTEILSTEAQRYLHGFLKSTPATIPSGPGEDLVRTFKLRFVALYFVGFGFSIGAAILCLWHRNWRLLGIPLYFLAMTAGHYYGATEFCPSCITPYTGYFYAFSSIAAGIACFLIFIASEGMVLRGLLVIAMPIAIFSINVYLGVSSGYLEHRFRLWSNLAFFEQTYDQAVRSLATEIERHSDLGDRILVIGGRTHGHHAVYIAGRIPEITTIHPVSSYFPLRQDISEVERPHVLTALRSELKWSELSMRYWIEEAYDTILIGPPGEAITAPWIPLIETHFWPIAMITVQDRQFTLFRRRESRSN